MDEILNNTADLSLGMILQNLNELKFFGIVKISKIKSIANTRL